MKLKIQHIVNFLTRMFPLRVLPNSVFIWICLVCFGGYSCQNIKSENKKTSLPTMLIFDHIPNQKEISFEDTDLSIGSHYEAEIAFVDSCGRIQYLSPGREMDTLIIYGTSDYIEVSHLYKALENLYFFIKSGDTVLFSYDEKKYPILTSYTSEELTRQYNFFAKNPHKLSYFDFEPLTLLSNDFFWRIYEATKNQDKDMPKQLRALYVPIDIIEVHAKNYLKEYEKELKEQQKTHKFSVDACKYYNYLLQNKTIEFQTYIFHHTEDTALKTWNELERIYKDFFNDEHCCYMSYWHGIDRFLLTYKSLTIFPGSAVEHEGSGYYYQNCMAMFNHIATQKSIPEKTRKYILFKLLSDIQEVSSMRNFERYVKKYTVLTGDSIFSKNRLLENFKDVKNDDIQLQDESGKELSFTDIRTQFHGKVIYLDFWASWCAPCRTAIKEAIKLRKDYENRDIVFLYLALNDRKKEWKNAIKDLKIDGKQTFNYFIVNSKSSKAIQELKVESIPRYLIYDKNGTLLYFRAPSPCDSEIRTILDNAIFLTK